MKEFYITDDGIRLHAKLDMPSGYEVGAKCPLVIIIHGLTGHMEERHIVATAQMMNEIGFATLRAEMYGHGGSEGDFSNHNIMKWVNNAMTVTEYARSLEFVTDLYLSGHSQGGLTTILTAGIMPDYFKAIIPLSPAIIITDGARTGRAFGGGFDPAHVPAEMYVNTEKKVKGNYIRAAQLVDTDYAIRSYHGPVLIVHGDADQAVPIRYAEETAAKYENAELVVIPGDSHCFDFHLDEMVEAVREFLLKVR